MELEPYWNGTLERQGRCPTLSSYAGASTLGTGNLGMEPSAVVKKPAGYRRPRLSPEKRAKIAKLSELDLSSREIAEAVGCSRWSVKAYRRTGKKKR